MTALKAMPAETSNADLIAKAKADTDAEADAAKKAGMQAVVDALVARAAGKASGDTLLAAANAAKAGAVAAGVVAVAPQSSAILDLNGLKLEAAEPGSWGNALRARITVDQVGSSTFNLTILDGFGNRTEEFLGVNTDPAGPNNPRHVADVLASQSGPSRPRARRPPCRVTPSPTPIARWSWRRARRATASP
jgi:hypothetical protein